MDWEIAKSSVIGGRDSQQDRVEIVPIKDGGWVLVVADGMGGHEGGELAAQCVVDVTREQVASQRGRWSDPKGFLQLLCDQAHARIVQEGKQRDISPHSTCVVLVLIDNRAHWMHVGDSRLYHFREGQCLERTRDHSVVELLVRMGKAREEEINTHPDRSRLLNSLGGKDDPEPDFGEATVHAGDGFLLCSDGLWEAFKLKEISDVFTTKSLEWAGKRLVDVAVERQGKKSDNTTVILARVAHGSAQAVDVLTSQNRQEQQAVSRLRSIFQRRSLVAALLGIFLVLAGAVYFYGSPGAPEARSIVQESPKPVIPAKSVAAPSSLPESSGSHDRLLVPSSTQASTESTVGEELEPTHSQVGTTGQTQDQAHVSQEQDQTGEQVPKEQEQGPSAETKQADAQGKPNTSEEKPHTTHSSGPPVTAPSVPDDSRVFPQAPL